MPVNHYVFSIPSAPSSPTRLTPEGREVGGSLTVHIQNTGAHDLFLGGEGLTLSSYGRHLEPQTAFTFENLTTVDEVYAIAESNQTGQASVIIVKR